MSHNLEPIKDIILSILSQNPELNVLIQHLQLTAITITPPQLPTPNPSQIDVLDSYIKWHIPTKKFKRAKNHLLPMIKPLGGFNSVPSLGGWVNDKDKWELENIRLVTSFAPFPVIRQHLLNILLGSYQMGKAIQESAIGLEIGIPDRVWMLIIPTR
ncbi:hypothetical protein [Argonema antarcticum]|uniref:hypothetical protein n=1 Tax=Argonema antarcticum TaxID=2942763 RepID=UPI00201334E8|nr:hypothetical protein [Argonema antarcticum]MCL1470503.1 hypothetical protein [Argonema antarcticum A004/B2]